jgi:uncharacterized membrane protein YidH (DUF202 family)
VKPDRQIRYARYLGIVFCLGGFAAIAVGWNGAARTAQPDSQLPYLLSGGAVGIGLIVFGVGLMLVAQIRSERTRLQGVVDLMGPAVKKLVPQVEARADKGPEPFLFQVRHARVFALVCTFAGFVAIALGWMGMARSAAADQQLPYIISGGMGGVGLITFGVAVLLVAQIRTERQRLATVLEVLAIGLSKATRGEPIALEQETGGGVAPDTLVVAGPSTFHRSDCRLIQGKPGLDRLTVQVARSAGLSPCRVCDPLGTNDRQAEGDATQKIGPAPTGDEATQKLEAGQTPMGSDEGTR